MTTLIPITAASDPWITLLTSQPIGTYSLGHCIGEGYFSHVFEAVNTTTGARFAIKVLRHDADARSIYDFENEGLLLRQLNACDGVISYVDGGTATVEVFVNPGLGMPLPVRYLVMTLASGSVDELIDDPVARATWGWDARLRVFRGAVKAVRQMHLKGVAHRDLKSSNTLVLVSDGETRVRLNDLGRAKDLGLGPTLPMEAYLMGRGDIRFAPPEALHIQAGASPDDFLAADYYGLGSLLVELAAGQPMTSLALGDIGSILKESKADFRAGRRGDLSALTLQYRSAISDVVASMPPPIREDAAVVLNNLCHPVPGARLLRAPFSKDRMSRDRLSWVLRRADIMIHRLEVELLERRRFERRGRMTA